MRRIRWSAGILPAETPARESNRACAYFNA